MKKTLSLLFVSIISFFVVITVKAYEYNELPVKVQNTFEGFVFNLNNGSDYVYDYIDSSNTKLRNNVKGYLGDINLNNEVLDATTISDNYYKVEARIDASGGTWNVSGFKVYYEIKLVDGEYKLVDTNLFEFIGSENVIEFVGKTFIIIGVIVTVVFLVVLIVAIVLIVKSRKKKIVTGQMNIVSQEQSYNQKM